MPVSMLAKQATMEVFANDPANREVLEAAMLAAADQALTIADAAGRTDGYGERADHYHLLDLTMIGLFFEQEILRHREMDVIDRMLMALLESKRAARPVHRAQLQAMRIGYDNGALVATEGILHSLVDMTPDLAALTGVKVEAPNSPESMRLLDLVYIGLLYERDLL